MTKSAVRKMMFILRIKTLLSARAAGVFLPKKIKSRFKSDPKGTSVLRIKRSA